MMDHNTCYPSFSVAMCVYGKDNPEWFDKAIGSVVYQTVIPEEIVIVVDGPVSYAINDVIKKYQTADNGITFKVVRFEKNHGHGTARRMSVGSCSNEIVALMDADDVSCHDRFEQQLRTMGISKADVIGGTISEFIEDEDNVIGYRNVPASDSEIKKYMKKRCPMNQVTIIFKKDVYDRAGGYQDWYCEEDYWLWIRMAQQGAVFANTGSVLVNVRAGKEMYQRRGGIRYFRSEAELQKYMLNHHLIGYGRFFINIVQRLVIQVMLPDRLRGLVYQKIIRRKSI